MNDPWKSEVLRKLAVVRVSNVDKKTHPSEKPVKLCNYMDVYPNDYITSDLNFMEASASSAEIERFSLQKGDVIITKDSETPHDIGIPALLNEEIANLVCGYHLALIRPKTEHIDSIYLAKYLSTSQVARYFAVQASGSTRFGLPISAIESVVVLLPPLLEQSKIAKILSTMDKAIEQTEALIAKQQRIKTGLMQDFLTRGIDEYGNLRSEETHEFKDSALGRIPVEWEVKRIDSIAKVSYGISDAIDITNKSGIATITLPCVDPDGHLDISISKLAFTLKKNVKERDILKKGDLLFNWRNGSQYHLGKTAYFNHEDNFTHVGFLLKIRTFPDKCDSRFLWFLINDIKVNGYFFNAKIQVNNTFNSNELNAVQIALPKVAEQYVIRDRLNTVENIKEEYFEALNKLRFIKTGLIQDLLTGKKRVTPLLDIKDGDSMNEHI